MKISKESKFLINIKWLKIYLWKKNILTTCYKMKIYLKMIQIITKLDELFTYVLNIDCTISITIENVDSCDFTKNIWTSFSFKQA